MFFLLFGFLPGAADVATGFRSVIKPKTAFFLFWILFFVVSHLWNFSTAPWNGDGLFEDSAVDLLYLKSYVIGHPFQAAWFHPLFLISRETLFHYYVWGFLHLFGYNIVSYEAALLVLWCTAFVFMLLLVDHFFRSSIVTSMTALVFSLLPFPFIYTFVGYRYPMTICFCLASLYFLHLGFTNRLVPGKLYTREAVSPGTWGFRFAVRRASLEEAWAKRQVEFGINRDLWARCGCHAHSLLHHFQSRTLHLL
jgi:hypothetical protein